MNPAQTRGRLLAIPPWQFLGLILGLCLVLSPARAEQTVEQGPWVLHYMTLNTTELTPEVARAYGVTRTKRRGLLMLNLQRRDAPLQSVDHTATGRVRNLIGQTKIEEQRRVEAGGAIYTLLEYAYSHLETLRFDFAIQPANSSDTIPLKFNQQHFTPGR